MTYLLRHVGVLCVLLAAAFLISLALPLEVDARGVMLTAVGIFVAYLGVFLIWKPKARRKSAKP